MKSVSGILVAVYFSMTCLPVQAQSPQKETKPYKVILSGRQLTIRSSKAIRLLMLWTTDGYRVVEQKIMDQTSCTIEIPVHRKAFYLMIGLTNGKIYTEKILSL